MKMISGLGNLSYKDREGEKSEVVLPGEVKSGKIQCFLVGDPHHQEKQTEGRNEISLEPKEI